MWFSRPDPKPEAPFFSWKAEEHSVGVRVFDEEHKHLAEFLTRVHRVLKARPDRAQALQIMEELLQETRAHFAHEERVFEEVRLEGREAHAREHQVLLQEIQDLIRQYKGGVISSLSIPTYLRNWLIPHIQQTDRGYRSALGRLTLR